MANATLIVISIAAILQLAVANAGPPVHIELFEGIPAERTWQLELGEPSESFDLDVGALIETPQKYDRGLRVDRSNPFLVRMTVRFDLPAGRYQVLLRAKNAARLHWNDRVIAETEFLEPNADGHDRVPDPGGLVQTDLQPLAPGHQQQSVEISVEQPTQDIVVETVVGGKKLRNELGELVVAVARAGEPFQVLGFGEESYFLTEQGWHDLTVKLTGWMAEYNTARRRQSSSEEDEYWARRHRIARRIVCSEETAAPPTVAAETPVRNDIDRFIGARLELSSVRPTPLCDDHTFLRRVSLDTVGVIPTPEEISVFENDSPASRRSKAIDRLLGDPRWADHWVSYWQDLLAENPGLLKPKLNNTGPFRWWIYESFSDNKPMDRFATELIMMQGSTYGGGPAGFAMATQNDVPMAAKAHIIAKAFLGIEMKCARCHDAPLHDVKQQDTFSLAAMLAQKPISVPDTSVVPTVDGTHTSAVEVSLNPGDEISPFWPFASLSPDESITDEMLQNVDNWRERTAALITSPHNDRFAQVIVNRLWKQYLGRGIVEPVDDWQNAQPSHPRLLNYLARQLLRSGYDLKHVARLILNSHVYQREVVSNNGPTEAEDGLYAGPSRRRLSAEQIVDSLLVATGQEFASERLSLDPEGRRPVTTFLDLGIPNRAWQMAPLSNERDRPALSLPAAQSVLNVMTTFGWRESRQEPTAERDLSATVLQPLVLANGLVGRRATRLTDDSLITELALRDQSVDKLVAEVFRRLLSRDPTVDEQTLFVDLLSDGYQQRRVEGATVSWRLPFRHAVSWSNHLSPEATSIKLEMERRVREGAPVTSRLISSWRERMEDMVWALVNSPEFVFVP